MGRDLPEHDRPAAARLAPLRNVDGLRGLCTSGVLLYHCWLYSSPNGQRLTLHGWETLLEMMRYGRVLFLVLSGFLLYRSWANAIVTGAGLPSTRRYLLGSGLRILPAYWTALLLVGVVFGVARTDFATFSTGSLLSAPGTFLADAFLVQNFFPGIVLTGIGPTWTLAIEVQFYVLLPLLALSGAWLARFGPLRGAMAPAALLVCVGIGTKVAAAVLIDSGLMVKSSWDGSPYGLLMLSLPFNADQFGLGMALAVMHVARASGRDSRAMYAGSAVACALVFAPLLVVLAKGIPGRIQFFDAPVALLSAYLIHALAAAPSEPGWARPVRRLLDTRPLVALGTISYGIFLYNEPVTLLLSSHGWTRPGWEWLPVNGLASFTLAAALAALSYNVVERRFLAMKRRAQARPAQGTGDGVIALIVGGQAMAGARREA